MNPLVFLGFAAFALGVAAMVAPGLLPIPVDRAFVYLVGLVALVQAYGVTVARFRAGLQRTETPDPEVLRPSPVPGEDGSEAIEGTFGSHWYLRRSELRQAAVAVMTRYRGLTEAAASTSLANGSWTDDPVAARHLSEEDGAASVVEGLRRFVRRESAYQHGRRRAIEAIARLAGIAVTEEPAGGPRRRDVRAGRERDDDEPGRSPTGHWRGVGVVALLAVGVGVLSETAPVVLAGVVGVGFAAYARVSPEPTLDIELDRTLATDRPEPGESVEVTLSVRNAGGGVLPDLRIVDGVPGGLSVESGSPRLGTALRPGEVATVTYEVAARRGDHVFDPVTVIARDVAAVGETSRRVGVESTLVCVPTLRPVSATVPLRRTATQYAGQVRTTTGGDGIEFHATRAYQPGDPTNRIDWNRKARTGELATLEFREERAATVVVAVDARETCFVAPEPHAPHAVDRAVEAAGRLFASLVADGNRVGITAFGTDCWLAPGTGTGHRTAARDLLATHPRLASSASGGATSSRWRRRLERRLPNDAQLIVLTPLCDADSAGIVRRFDALGHPTAVISPDPTVAYGAGPLLATVARQVRVTDLRRVGVPVVDWSADEPLDAALARAGGRRSP